MRDPPLGTAWQNTLRYCALPILSLSNEGWRQLKLDHHSKQQVAGCSPVDVNRSPD
jgi:hypothetical protein